MFRRTAVIAGALAMVVGLSGCSLLETDGGAEPLTGVAACALGNTWQLDMADMATKVKDDLQKDGLTSEVTLDGSQTLDWDLKGHVVLTSDFVMTVVVPVTADFTVTINRTQTGTVDGTAYISSEVAIPRKWDESNLTVDTVINDGAIEESPWPLPTVGFDDSVGLELTCDGDTLTIHPRGERSTQVWTKV